jgi:tRNA modification GTPase
VQVDGLPITLIDTAGLRDAGDAVEAEGIRRARAEMQRADRLLYVLDAAVPDNDVQLDPAVPTTLVVNKIDLVGGFAHVQESGATTTIHLSALTGAGVELLWEHLKRSAGYHGDSGALSARRRHLDALARAHTLVKNASDTLASTLSGKLRANSPAMTYSVRFSPASVSANRRRERRGSGALFAAIKVGGEGISVDPTRHTSGYA